ncbi:MAG: hypothetical protein AAF927_02260 [Bacteroidota bacterium]
MDSKDIVPKVQGLIRRGKIAQAIDTLYEWSEELQEEIPDQPTLGEIHSTILLISSRYHMNLDRKKLGDISDQDARVEDIKIQSAIISVLNEIKGLKIEEKYIRRLLRNRKTVEVSRGNERRLAVVTITIAGDIDDWQEENQQKFNHAVSDILSIREGEVTINRVFSGSINFLLTVPNEPLRENITKLYRRSLFGFKMTGIFIFDKVTFLLEDPNNIYPKVKKSPGDSGTLSLGYEKSDNISPRTELASQIRSLIGQAQLEQAITTLTKYANRTAPIQWRYLQDIYQIEASFASLEDEYFKGALDRATYDQGRLEIIKSILDIIQDIQND